MVILLTGDNAYQAAEEVRRLEDTLHIALERFDGNALTQSSLADIMKGASLFAEQRLVLIRDLSSSSELWTKAAEWTPLVDDAVTIIFRDEKPDKRTKAYKQLVASARVIEATSWSEKQSGLAEKWLNTQMKAANLVLSPALLRDMVHRALAPSQKPGQRIVDQLLLMRAIEAFHGAEEVTQEMIDTVMPVSTSDAVFDLLALAVHGETKLLHQRLHEFRATQDGYQLFALVLAQWTQLAMLAMTKGEATLDIHPFVRQKLNELARRVPSSKVRETTHLAARLDGDLKSTSLDPWDALTRLLIEVTPDS